MTSWGISYRYLDYHVSTSLCLEKTGHSIKAMVQNWILENILRWSTDKIASKLVFNLFLIKWGKKRWGKRANPSEDWQEKKKSDGKLIQDLRDRLRMFYLNGENSGLQSENKRPKWKLFEERDVPMWLQSPCDQTQLFINITLSKIRTFFSAEANSMIF